MLAVFANSTRNCLVLDIYPDRRVRTSAWRLLRLIQHHLDAHGLARKDLIRDYLFKSTIDKLFQGEFSKRTLTKIEAILKISLTSKPWRRRPGAGSVWRLHAAGRRIHAGRLSLCAPHVHPPNEFLSAYIIRIVWDRTYEAFALKSCHGPISNMPEEDSSDVPFGTPFINLVSTHLGNLRTVLLSLPGTETASAAGSSPRSATPKDHVHAGGRADFPKRLAQVSSRSSALSRRSTRPTSITSPS